MLGWCAAEEVELRARYPREPWEDILRALPGRSKVACAHRARRLGVLRVERDFSVETRQKLAELARANKPRLGKVRVPLTARAGVQGKACSECLEWQPLSKFAQHSEMPNKRNVCTMCEGKRAYAGNPARCIAAVRKYQDEYPAETRLRKRAADRRRHGRKVAGRGVSAQEYRELLEVHGGLCAYCVGPADTIDHVMPLSRGGLHEVGNLVPACKSCNFNKHDKTLAEWQRVAR